MPIAATIMWNAKRKPNARSGGITRDRRLGG
jgi:hypothetical protein